eukprot:scaffold11731_cov119-Isochrysis_galbana.AAC.7
MQRTNWISPACSAATRARNDSWNESTTPQNLLERNLRFAPPAPAPLAATAAACAAAASVGRCMRAAINGLDARWSSTNRSWQRGSLFLERKPVAE